ncbi:hypothetical protein H1P_6340019 [Hyella patelloides LEGE 07179]|uniref:Uncharacterized protein n=1 Tax=Hyella patelloides LEGE 07179 TaxID=945734 RepID=A0A563W1Z9_9CYAN|nr:hypothetical protein [Hyella patelloides]VEP17690.1 hypothetical protein H1P_6340019 [Hyella patelloides LEGE 07179]
MSDLSISVKQGNREIQELERIDQQANLETKPNTFVLFLTVEIIPANRRVRRGAA